MCAPRYNLDGQPVCALPFTPDTWHAVYELLRWRWEDEDVDLDPAPDRLIVDTRGGRRTVEHGDWVIRYEDLTYDVMTSEAFAQATGLLLG